MPRHLFVWLRTGSDAEDSWRRHLREQCNRPLRGTTGGQGPLRRHPAGLGALPPPPQHPQPCPTFMSIEQTRLCRDQHAQGKSMNGIAHANPHSVVQAGVPQHVSGVCKRMDFWCKWCLEVQAVPDMRGVICLRGRHSWSLGSTTPPRRLMLRCARGRSPTWATWPLIRRCDGVAEMTDPHRHTVL